MNIAILGSRGQLGSALVQDFRVRGWNVLALTRTDHNVTTPDLRLPQGIDAVVNCAAFHRIAECEQRPLTTFDVNALGGLNVARAADHANILNVYVSTDFVLDPNNVYAISKLAGEEFTRRYSRRYLIVRFGSLFGGVPTAKGPSFVDQILVKAQQDSSIDVISDTVLSPAYTKDVAKLLGNCIVNHEDFINTPIVNLSNRGICSYYEFALEIVRQAGFQTPIYPVHNRNPHLPQNVAPGWTLGFRSWQEALREYITEIEKENPI